MNRAAIVSLITFALLCLSSYSLAQNGHGYNSSYHYYKPYYHTKKNSKIQLGPRPFYLVDDMDKGRLKHQLKACKANKLRKTDFSIGHRGAPLQFPEHTKESYEAAAKMGAGIMECDVTFTKDKELVCRHSQCDLATTTNILEIPELAAKCSIPFTPANSATNTPAQAQCCTSDITLDEFKMLKGKMDASNPSATNVQEFMGGTADWRTNLYANKGTLMTHKESIQLFKKLGVKYTPELKAPNVEMPYEGTYSQEDYAQQMINEYKEAGIPSRKVWAQSFNIDDVKYWINNEPRFGKQAVYLDSRVYNDTSFEPTLASMEELTAAGINIIAPPMWALLDTDMNNHIIPSEYANNANKAGLDIITWTLKRTAPLSTLTDPTGDGWYYQTVYNAIDNDGDILTTLDVLAKDVGIIGIFSDWPATVTYYANCMGL